MRVMSLVFGGDEAEAADPTSEASLVARVRKGEASALGEVYDRHHAHVRAFASRLLGDRHSAEDLVHDVFVALPKALGRYRGEASLKSFLMGVAANHARHHVRAASRRRRTWESFGQAEEMRSETRSPEREAEQTSAVQALHRALDKLPIAQRVAFIVCEVEGKTSSEAALLLDVPEGTVRTRLFHARSALREMLREEGDL